MYFIIIIIIIIIYTELSMHREGGDENHVCLNSECLTLANPSNGHTSQVYRSINTLIDSILLVIYA